MKITRQEAYEILELEEGADFEQVKKAYRRKGMDWHPDKHPEENREVATVEFQKIGAAFSKLRDDEMSSDDDDYSYSDDDDLDDFFAAYMGGHRGGGGGGGFGFRSSNGFVYVNVPDFFSFGGPPTGHRARRREQRANPFHHFSSGGGMGFRDKEFYDKLDKEKKQAEEQTEKYKEKAEKERNARQEQDRRCRWLEKLGRLTRLSFTDTSIKLSADTKGARTAHFPSYKIPDNFLWEMQYKPSGTAEEYMTLTVKDSMECDVTGLQPGTQYVFRARTGVILDASEGKMEFGDWNMEYKTSTSGVAPKQSASSKPGSTATPATAGAGVNGNGTGGGRKKAQKKAAAAEKKNVKQEQQGNVDDEAAAAKAAAEKEREERLKAAMEAAAADYAAATGAASTTNKPEKDSLSQQQESNTSTKKKNKKKTTSAAPTFAPSAELPPVDQQPINDKAASLPDSSTTPLSTQTTSTTQPIVLPATLDEPHLPSLLKDWVQANMDTDNEKYTNNDSNSISNHDSTGTDQAVGTANGNMFSALLDDEAPEPKPLNADQAKFENKKKEDNKKEVDTANGEIHRPLFPPPPPAAAAAAAQFQPMPPTTHAAVRGGRGRRGGRGGRGGGRGYSQGVYEKYEHSPSNLPPVPIRASAFAAPPLHAAPPLWEPTPAAPPSRAAPPKRSPAPAAPPLWEPTLAAPPAPPTDVPVRPPPKQRPVKKYVPLTNIPPKPVSTAPVIQVQNTQSEQQEQQVKEKKKRTKKPKQQKYQKEDELQVQQQEQHQEQQERQEVQKTLKEKKPRKPKQPKATPARPPPPGLVLHPVTTLPTGTGGAVEAAPAPTPAQSEAKIKKKRYRNKDKYNNTGSNPNGGVFNAAEVNFQPFDALGF